MPILHDDKLGDITLVRRVLASRIRAKIAPNGTITITAPQGTPTALVRLFLRSSRRQLQSLIDQHQAAFSYRKSQPIGKSHRLLIEHGPTLVTTTGTSIVVRAPDEAALTSAPFQQRIRRAVIAALQKEAKSYLPRRLRHLADEHQFLYKTTRIMHASSRWGSCSSRGTISLNIALMTLPFELIDYVLIHELCHTRHMDHSAAFWREVAAIDPRYKTHRQLLKSHTPYV
ncbi:MAG: SprT family zinc-dependent metalloprotease [Candidatus Saccharibacteria bacterium]|nr:SprT family zinc-dependent metalloprotease [Candidatus Saccharibacteria bacterium]